MTQETILSGIQPSGRLHIGNYFGALKHFVDLQNQGHHCTFLVVDYHSITQDYDPKEKRAQVLELGREFLAAGLDPTKSTIAVQSDIPEHTELGWILSCLTPISFLERMTQYKDKSSRQAKNINLGLFAYPVLQAADILLYHPTAVPVGQDQDQHLELTREIARLFNNRFGATFKEPKTIHTEVPKVMSILDPEKKMSKSLGDGHCIFLDDPAEVIQKKLAKAPTDSGDGKGTGAKNLLVLLQLFAPAEVSKPFVSQAKAGTIRYAELKSTLADHIADHFADFRKRKNELSDEEVKSVFAAGQQKAGALAATSMELVRKRIGVR